GRGFESPTLNELAYRTGGGAGFNDSLRPQTSRQFEAGIKWRSFGDALAVDSAFFDARTLRLSGTSRKPLRKVSVACQTRLAFFIPGARRPPMTWLVLRSGSVSSGFL